MERSQNVESLGVSKSVESVESLGVSKSLEVQFEPEFKDAKIEKFYNAVEGKETK